VWCGVVLYRVVCAVARFGAVSTDVCTCPGMVPSMYLYLLSMSSSVHAYLMPTVIVFSHVLLSSLVNNEWCCDAGCHAPFACMVCPQALLGWLCCMQHRTPSPLRV
jgi:hypothetical protein